VKGAIDEALRCKEEGVGRTILFNLCGHGHFDMQAYMDYFGGKLTDNTYDESELAMALAGLPSGFLSAFGGCAAGTGHSADADPLSWRLADGAGSLGRLAESR
jgi:hypothetical protein